MKDTFKPFLTKLNEFTILVRSKYNFRLYALVIVIVLGYLFFFLSNLIFQPDPASLPLTDLNSAVELYPDREIKITRWDYSPAQDLMEVELEITNNAFDGQDSYKIYAGDNDENAYGVNTIVEESNFLVIQIPDVPNKFTYFSLHLYLETPDEETVVYTNSYFVNQVSSLQAKTKLEYQIDRLNRMILEYHNEISEYEAEVRTNNSRIENIQTLNEKLEDDKRYQTESEIEETNSAIQSNLREIENMEQENENLAETIAEVNEKIQNAEQRLNELNSQQ